jgi:hypothetical protein
MFPKSSKLRLTFDEQQSRLECSLWPKHIMHSPINVVNSEIVIYHDVLATSWCEQSLGRNWKEDGSHRHDIHNLCDYYSFENRNITNAKTNATADHATSTIS